MADGTHDRSLDGPMPNASATAADSTTLAVYDSSPGHDGAALPLVLVHGYTAALVNWVDVIDELASDRRVVAFDHRGHGQSGHAADPSSYRLTTLADDVIRVADAVGIERFHLLGHSLGGAVVQYVAFDNPDRVASLVLMDTSADGFGSMGMSGRERIREIVQKHGWGEAWMRMQRAAPDEPLPTWMSPELDTLLLERRRRRHLKLDPNGLVELARELEDMPDLKPRLAELTMPVTVLVGEHDGGLVKAAERMVAALPRANHAVIEASAHNPHDENRQAWLAAMRSHLAAT